MACDRGSTVNRWDGITLAAFIAVGLTALTAAPPARAEVIDDLINQALTPFMDAATNTIDWAEVASPTAWDAFLAPAHWDAVFADLSALGAGGATMSASSTADLTTLFQEFVYTPIHTGVEDWIGSDLGKQIDGVLNTVVGSYMIGDGAAGTADHPDGGAAGWLFGDGGAGFDSTTAGVAGGDGGAAGFFGNGGDGGNGGIGDTPSGLPALGGAGGNGGVLGIHGTVGASGAVSGGTSSSDADGLSTTGTWLTDSDGRVVVLHGLNEVYKIAPYEPSAGGFSADDAQFLEDNGFNVVRLGVIWAGVEPEPGVYDDAYLASIAQTVQMLSDHGIRVILDMHQDSYSGVFGGEGAPAWAVQTGGLSVTQNSSPLSSFFDPAGNHAWDAFWANAEAPNGLGLEDNYAQMWEYLANYFKGNSDIAGYEIMNEPWSGSQWLQTLLGSSHFDAQELTPFYDQTAAAIRAVDPDTPLLIDPNFFSSVGLSTHLGTVDASHTVYSFHDYCLQAMLFETSFGCGALVDANADGAVAYAEQHNMPAWMTEFGATNQLSVIADTMQAADKNRVSWTEWAYSGQNDITTGSTPTNEALVYDPSKSPVGDNVNAAKLATLAEPYPQLVAGTPDSWSYHSGTFTFSYSTEMADGQGGFAAGSQTEISVPAADYPNGYQVSVTGGHVVSAANASTLVIESNHGASTISVVVSPAAAGANPA